MAHSEQIQAFSEQRVFVFGGDGFEEKIGIRLSAGSRKMGWKIVERYQEKLAPLLIIICIFGLFSV